MELTAEIAKTLVHYEPETGVFTRLVRTSQSVQVGEVAGYRTKRRGYIQISVAGRAYMAHRVAWLIMTGAWPIEQVDHINGKPADNRWVNLRAASNDLNAENKRSPSVRNTSGLLGVSWMERARKWRAQVHVDGRPLYLGLFTSKEEAHEAYLQAKRQHHAGCTI